MKKTVDSDLKSAKTKKRRKILAVCLMLAVLLPSIAIGASALGFAIWAQGIPLDKSLLPTASEQPTFYDINGIQLSYISDDYLAPDAIPKQLADAFVALEDKRFYSHKGYDLHRMVGAMWNNVKAMSLREGASTITQQLVKNTHLSHERTLSRKLKEIAIAVKLEKEYSKQEILAMYLSVIYFGNGAYGVKQAARQHFGKDVDSLTLSECATLAGIVKNPSGYSPSKHPEAAIQRRNLVLKVMMEQNYISQEEYDNASSAPLICDETGAQSTDNATFYIKQAAKEVCERLGITQYQLNNSGYKIYTNLDSTLQNSLAQQAKIKSNYKNGEISDNVSIVIDNKSGAILAHHSSLPYSVKRQAGSTLKPIAVYAPAIEEKIISLATPLVDEKLDFNGYSPRNFDDVYYGKTTVRESIKKSMNSAAVRVIDYLGAERARDYLNRFGIATQSSDANYALALGATANGIDLIQLAGAYSVLARGGIRIEPSYINRITDGENKLYQSRVIDINNKQISSNNSNLIDYFGYSYPFQEDISANRTISAATSAQITSALCDTATSGTARGLSALPFSVAAKTGTAQRADGKNSDAYNVSYTTAHTLLVWHGSDDGFEETGGSYPTRHAYNLWKDVYKSNAYPTFDIQNQLVRREVDLYSTSKNKTVTFASENTPQKYRAFELFAPDYQASGISCFDLTPPISANIERTGNKVYISLTTDDIYRYTVYRKDALGTTIIADIIPDDKDYADGENKTITIADTPLSIGNAINYVIESYPKHISTADAKRLEKLRVRTQLQVYPSNML